MGNLPSRLTNLDNTSLCCTNALISQPELHLPDQDLKLPIHSPPKSEVYRSIKRSLPEPGVATFGSVKECTTARSVDLDIQNEDRLMKIEEAVHYSKLLCLKVVSSRVIEVGSQLVINAMGYDCSTRKEKDGVVYFGNKLKGYLESSRELEIVNDVKIPLNDKELANNHRGRQFQILYDPYSSHYYIKDLSIGFGVFARLDSPLSLRDNHLLYIGESFIVVNMLPNQNGLSRLRLKLYGGPCSGEIFHFNASEFTRSQIRIGRMQNCEVQIEDSLISKYQSTIVYDLAKGWVVVDGEAATARKSTNGTWLYINENMEVTDGLTFKTNNTVFQVSLM